MKLLSDDISVTYQNMGTTHGLPFVYNRHTSQGRQKSYSVRTKSYDDDNLLRSKRSRYPEIDTSSAPILERQYAVSRGMFNYRSIANNFGTMDEFDDNNNKNEESTLFNSVTGNLVKDSSAERIQFFNSVNTISDYMEEEHEDNLDNYIVSNDVTSCYSTPSVLDTMRSFSQNL
jgi:hypothetical protein